MRKFAVLLLLVALTVLGATLWGYANARLELSTQSVRALEGEQYAQRFGKLKEQLRSGAVRGLVYEAGALGEASDYTILEYTIAVRNKGFIRAQMVEAIIQPLRGDVLCYSQQEADSIDVNTSLEVVPGRQLMLRVYLLTRKDLHAVRDIQVSYYIWGHPFIIKVKYG